MIGIALKATLAIVLVLALVAAARRARASMRHLLLTALFLFLLLLPFASRFVPARDVNVPDAAKQFVVAEPSQPTESSPIGTKTTWRPTLLNAYLAVSAILIAWLALGVLRLRRMAADGEVWLEGTSRMNELAVEADIRRVALVMLSSATAVPLTFGFRRSTIVLPESAREWDADELRRALRHELEHVRREDWAAQLLARFVCALYWAHPLVWVAWRRFCFEAERACDDAVVGTFADAEDYAGQLVALAKRVRFSMVPALGMASRSRLAQRVHALLDPSQRRGPLGRFAAASVLAVTMVVLITIAPVRLIAQVQEQYTKKKWSQMGELLTELGEKGRIDLLRQYLDSGIDVNTVAEGDGTALIGAARAGQVETVRFLIERGADVNLESLGDGNPLIAAAEHGHREIVEILLDEGANIDTVVPGDENPIIQAAWNGHASIVDLLIARGADVNVRVVEHGELRTALRMARKYHYDKIERMLLAAGARE